MYILIGSRALHRHNLNRNPPKDYDYWYSGKNPFKGMAGYDCKEQTNELLDLIPTNDNVATTDAVYTIKCSHLGWDIHWEKTKADVLWLEANGCKIIPELYNELIKVWEKEHGDKSFLSLDKDKEDFFTDGVAYTYDHDYLHELVSHPNPPIYTKALKDGRAVAIDKSKFDALPFKEQLRMFREEVTVIACERWVLNNYWRGKVDWYQAYGLALKKTITNLTKGWATDFIVCNLKHFVKPDYSYFEHILTTLSEDISMSKVDLSDFEQLLTESEGRAKILDELIYYLCEGEFGVACVTYPSKGESWGSYRKRGEDMIKKWEYQLLTQEGGGEGGAEECYGVFKLKGKTYKAHYSYYSYDGHEYDGITETLKEVKPVQKTVTIYE